VGSGILCGVHVYFHQREALRTINALGAIPSINVTAARNEKRSTW